MENKSNRLENYVIMPRQIVSDFRNGKITKAERDVLVWVRMTGNPYGKCSTSLDDLAKEAFTGGVGKNYANKILLALKSKKYLFYSSRKGRRGVFEIELGDWIRPDKTIKTLDSFFVSEKVRGETDRQVAPESEPTQQMSESAQKFEEEITLNTEDFPEFSPEEVRAYDTNTENNTENDTDCACTRICAHPRVGIQEIDSLRALQEKYGEDWLEEAWEKVEEEMMVREVEKPIAYLQTILINRQNS